MAHDTSVSQPINLHFNASARLMEIRAGTIVLMRVPIQNSHRLINRVRFAASRPARPENGTYRNRATGRFDIINEGYVIGEAATWHEGERIRYDALRAIDSEGLTASELATMWQEEKQRQREEATHMVSDELADMHQVSGLRRWKGLGAEQGAHWVWLDDSGDLVGVAA